MNKIIVYHGGTEVVSAPVCKFGRPNLDFGQGFYVTNIREQALSWAIQVAERRQKEAVLSRYLLDRDAIIKNARCKIFEAYDKDWLDFIAANRQSLLRSDSFDYVEGGVANDRVVDTVNLYIAGLLDIGTALSRLSEHQPNMQMCLLNQEILNRYLVFDGREDI